MKISVLHISDLHRDLANPICNQMLIDSLERDRDRYTTDEQPQIKSPDLIIVSGDIVQGVNHKSPNAETSLQQQYDEALNFLDDLTDRFVAGNKGRIVIVPGNHDISDYHFRQSLKAIEILPSINGELVEQLFAPNSFLRWSWTEFALYKIEDMKMYRKCLAAFCDFYSGFYEEKRSYSTDPAKQCDIFDFPDWGITIAGFCSCYNNDLFNKQGAISPDCIADVGNRLRDPSYQERLRIAVWHHNIEGPPQKMDYMDPDIAQNLIDGGFSLGFHGHQHKPQFLDTRFHHGPERRIAIIGTGTLCGNAPFRFGRTYNLVELDTEEKMGRLHVREMQNDNLQMPIWGARSVGFNSTSYLDFKFDSPPKPFVQANRNTTLLTRAQQLHSNSKYREASQILSSLAASEKLARPVLLDCLTQLDDMRGIIAAFDPPEGPAEAIALMDALWAENNQARLVEILGMPLVAESTDPSLIEMRTKYKRRLKK